MAMWCYPLRHRNITDGSIPVWRVHICDTDLDLPGTNVSEGDLAYTKDLSKWWKYAGSIWVSMIPTGGPGGGAPVDAPYIVASAHSELEAERVLTNTATVTWDLSTPGQVKADAVGGSGLTHAQVMSRLSMRA